MELLASILALVESFGPMRDFHLLIDSSATISIPVHTSDVRKLTVSGFVSPEMAANL